MPHPGSCRASRRGNKTGGGESDRSEIQSAKVIGDVRDQTDPPGREQIRTSARIPRRVALTALPFLDGVQRIRDCPLPKVVRGVGTQEVSACRVFGATDDDRRDRRPNNPACRATATLARFRICRSRVRQAHLGQDIQELEALLAAWKHHAMDALRTSSHLPHARSCAHRD